MADMIPRLTITIIEALSAAILCTVIIASVFWKKFSAASLALDHIATASPRRTVVANKVQWRMLGTTNNLKILNAVVGLVLVFVMNQFAGGERSPEVLAHHKAMLSNISDISFYECVGMVGTKNVNVAIRRNESTTFPLRVVRTSEPMATNVSNILAIFNSIESCLARREFSSTTTTAFDRFVHGNIVLKTIEKVKYDA